MASKYVEGHTLIKYVEEHTLIPQIKQGNNLYVEEYTLMPLVPPPSPPVFRVPS